MHDMKAPTKGFIAYLTALFFICDITKLYTTAKSNPCMRQNGGCVQQCIYTDEEVFCKCFPGFEMTKNGRNCEDTNECGMNNGGCQHMCTNIIGSYECFCRDNYVLSTNGHTCIPEEKVAAQMNITIEASPEQLCNQRSGYRFLTDGKCDRLCSHGNGGCQHRCVDKSKRRTFCKCHKNYILASDRKSCAEIQTGITLPALLDKHLLHRTKKASSCSVDNGGCDINCEETPAGAQCSCPRGFIPRSDGRSCEDINECDAENGGCHHTCHNSHGSFQCSCDDGYKLELDERACSDINECEMNDACAHTCLNSMGSYKCICQEGFVLFATARCGDIDECAVDNGGCHHNCLNAEGSFACTCSAGYFLHWNKKDCIIESKCPATALSNEKTGVLICNSRSKFCSLECQKYQHFESTTDPPTFSYTCGHGLDLNIADYDTTKYKWINSRMPTFTAQVSCPGTSGMIVRHKVKSKMTVRHCSLGLRNMYKPLPTAGQRREIASFKVQCQPLRKKRSLLQLEMDIFITIPKKCVGQCVQKRKAKAVKGIVKNIKKAINKQQFFLQMVKMDISIRKRRGIDFGVRKSCNVGDQIDDVKSKCLECPKGMMHNIQSDTCENCTNGFYQDQLNQLTCLPCPKTSLRTPESGIVIPAISTITKCPGVCQKGQFSATGMTPCLPCPINTYQPYFGRVGCYECGKGISTRGTGSREFAQCSVRARCSPGHYYDIRVSTCIRCPDGFYQHLNGENSCFKCPPNTTTDFDGAVDIESCKDRRCGGTMGDFQGVIQSPNYPGNYPINIRCHWTITPPKGRKILLVVPEIYLVKEDNCGDYLVIRKSASSSSTVTYESCQSFENPTALTARSKRLWIEFSSNNQHTAKGFQIPYVTYDENYDTIIKKIVEDGRLYSANYHQDILKDKKSRMTLFEVLAHPQNYFTLRQQNFRGLFRKSFIDFLQEKVITFLNPPGID